MLSLNIALGRIRSAAGTKTYLNSIHHNEMINSILSRIHMIKLLLGLSLLSILVGCQGQGSALKLAESVRPKVQKIMVVAVEAPPLEVIPDLLESRLPVYQSFHNMALPISPERKIYRNSGGILITGHVGRDDIVDIADFSESSDTIRGLHSIDEQSRAWLPTLLLATETAMQLNADSFQTVPASYMRQLPLRERDADLVGWRSAIARWYQGREADSQYAGLKDIDAVLELGIADYRVVHGHATLQLLFKLIDPESGRIIAKTRVKSRAFLAAASHQLNHDGAKFKLLFSDMGGV
nr:hypothetical protein [Methylomarinum sp. Ch1-1]MDP4520759.1 hypothetical protein [Methylomarinum sp. Ch1-1]